MPVFAKTVLILWYREFLLYFRKKLEISFTIFFPFVLLIIFGHSLSEAMQFRGADIPEGFKYIHFFFPGVLVGNLLFLCMFYSVSIIDDRDRGSLRAILISPAPRFAVVFGKVLGGASDALIGAIIGIALLPLAGVPLKASLFFLMPAILLLGIAFSSFGTLFAALLRDRRVVDKGMLFITVTMFLTSGALIPAKHSPQVIAVFGKFNPASYGVDLVRQIYFRIIGEEELISNFGISLFGVQLSIWHNILIITAFGLLTLTAAAIVFRKL